MKTKTLLALALVAPMLWLTQANAVTLTDGNNTATIQENSSTGMNSWTVNGVSELFQQWFWYRIGTTGAEAPINSISAAAIVNQTSNGVTLTYQNEVLRVDVTYSLNGGQPGEVTGDVGEQIKITNLSGRSMDLHFFQYSDFDLSGTIGDDSATMVNANTVRQWDSTSTLSETVATPAPSEWEINTYANTLTSLSDGSPTTLSNSIVGGNPGDMTWAFEWDKTLGVNGSLLISKDKNITTIPDGGSTLILIGAALGGLALLRRRRD